MFIFKIFGSNQVEFHWQYDGANLINYNLEVWHVHIHMHEVWCINTVDLYTNDKQILGHAIKCFTNMNV